MRTSTPITYTTILGYKLKESEKAIKFQCREIKGQSALSEIKDIWFPLSRTKNIIQQPEDSNEFDELTVESWLVDKNLDTGY